MKNSTLILNEDTTVFWLHDLVKHHGVAFDETYIHSHRGLLRHFASNISGFVAYDPSSQSTNAALIRCAAEDGVIAAGTAAMVAFLRDDLKLPMVANLSSSNPFDEFSISKGKLSNRAMVSQPNDGGKSNCLSEYAVFARIPTMEHNTDPSKPPSMMKGFQAVLDNFDQTALNAAYGWTSSDEHAFTASVTSAGGMVHASDFAYNMAVLSQLPPYVHANAPAARKRMDAGARSTKQVHTVAFVNSDGDNLQLLQNDWVSTSHWNDPSRGSVPVGWSYSPAMAVLMPNIMAYAVRTSTANDSLSTGPSGAGYAYPQLYRTAHKNLFATATAKLMKMAGMTLANVIGVTPSNDSLAHLAAQPEVESLVYFTFGVASQGYAGLHGNIAYINNKPIIGLRKNLWSGDPSSKDKLEPAELVKQMKLLPKDPTNPQSYTVVVNEFGEGLQTIAEAVQLLHADGGFEVVLPEELATRVVANTGSKQQCPLPTGPWADEAGNLPKCWLPGDGTCLMTCEQPSVLHIPASCDLNVCSNLKLAPTKLHFICVDTNKVCPSK